MSIIKKVFLVVGLAGLVLFGSSQLSPTVSAFIDEGACGNSGGGDICDNQDADINPLIQGIVNLLLYIAGVSAIIFIIIGGLKYAASAGDPGKAASGRNTVLYAAIGLAVTALAYAIVQYLYTTVIQ